MTPPPTSAGARSLLGGGRSAGFDDPVGMLHACHDRTRQRVDLLERLDAHLAAHGADGPAREAARDLVRFFDEAAAHHHEDEERHVLPQLRATGRAALADTLHAEHEAMRHDWATIRAELHRVSDDGDALRDGGSARHERWHAFADAYRGHIAREEAEAFEGLALGADIGAEMARRRGG